MGSQEEAAVHPYRTAKALPFELVQHCGIYLEEKLYTQALNLLSNILVSGTVTSSPAYVPSPQHLAVAATFLVHPSTTTRAKTSEEQEAASAALRLLRLTKTLIGPISAKFDVAFSFTHFESSRHGTRRRADDGERTRKLHNDEAMRLNFDLGGSGSLWNRSEDFWHAVGWAFNCSVLHNERWERWQLWLQFMCEVLETDWNERLRQFQDPKQEEEKTEQSGSSKPNVQILKDSLIFKYLATGSGGSGRNRRILRAIFADGSSSSVNEFRQIFKNELKKPKEEENIKKREAEVNIDQDEYADYLSRDEDEDEETDAANRRTSKRSKRPRRGTKAADLAANTVVNAADASMHAHGDLSLLGGYQSLALRQRLLHLLSQVSQHLPRDFTALEHLYHLFAENIRPLSFPIFQAFVNPSILPHFSPEAQTTLCEFLLFRMRESSAPATDESYLHQTKLEECFLPYAASAASIVDNAKVSITLEALIILLAESDMLEITDKLRISVEEGIENRAQKAQVEIKRSQSSRKSEEIEWRWLLESGERLMFLVNDVLPLQRG